jgi:hypothetical protein
VKIIHLLLQELTSDFEQPMKKANRIAGMQDYEFGFIHS